MNGYRTARKYIERLSDEDLQKLLEITKDDDDQETMVIFYLIQCEIKNRT